MGIFDTVRDWVAGLHERRLSEIAYWDRVANEEAGYVAPEDAIVPAVAERERAYWRGDDTAGGPSSAPDSIRELAMPQWMRDQAVETEAAIAAGTATPPQRDDPAEIAQRIDQLRGPSADGGPSSDAEWDAYYDAAWDAAYGPRDSAEATTTWPAPGWLHAAVESAFGEPTDRSFGDATDRPADRVADADWRVADAEASDRSVAHVAALRADAEWERRNADLSRSVADVVDRTASRPDQSVDWHDQSGVDRVDDWADETDPAHDDDAAVR